MPTLSCVIDGEAEDVLFSTNLETIAEDTSPALGMNTSAAVLSIQWVNASDIVVQPSNAYLEFDTSGITATPTSAKLKMYLSAKASTAGIGFYILRAFFASAGSLSAADQASYTRDASGATPDVGDITKYSSKIDGDGLNTSEFHEFTLNSTALSDMVSRDDFQIALVSEQLADQTSAAPNDGLTRYNNFRSQDYTDADYRPVLIYTLPANPTVTKILSGRMKINTGKLVIK